MQNLSRKEVELLAYDHIYSACRTTVDWMPELPSTVYRGSKNGPPYGYGIPEWIYKIPLSRFDSEDPIFWDYDEPINRLIFHFLSYRYPMVDIFEDSDPYIQLKQCTDGDVFRPIFWKRLLRGQLKRTRVWSLGTTIKISPVTTICWRAIARMFNEWKSHEYDKFIDIWTPGKTSNTTQIENLENVQEEIAKVESEIAEVESEIDFIAEGMEFLLNPEESWEVYCDEQVDLSREWLRWRGLPHSNEALVMFWQHTSFSSGKYKYESRMHPYSALFTYSGERDIAH